MTKYYNRTEIERLRKLEIIEQYMEIQYEHNVANKRLQLIEKAMPETKNWLWWLSNLSKVIRLILEILRYDDKTVLDKS